MPGWDNQKAGTIFEQMLVKTRTRSTRVAAANDGLANAVVVALKARKLKPIPLSGQDATDAGRPEHHLGLADDDGVQGRAEAGGCCCTAPRSTSSRQAARRPARSRRRADERSRRSSSRRSAITKANYKLLFTSGYLKRARRLQRRVHEVLQVGNDVRWEAPRVGSPPTVLDHDDDRERRPPSRAPRRSRRRSARSRR